RQERWPVRPRFITPLKATRLAVLPEPVDVPCRHRNRLYSKRQDRTIGYERFITRSCENTRRPEALREADVSLREGVCHFCLVVRENRDNLVKLLQQSKGVMNQEMNNAGEAHAIKCELAAEVLRFSGRLRLQVGGWSMLPSVFPGDTLLVEWSESAGV